VQSNDTANTIHCKGKQNLKEKEEHESSGFFLRVKTRKICQWHCCPSPGRCTSQRRSAWLQSGKVS